MNKQELGEVIGHLEALDSLATLFSRLWFDKVKDEVENEKTQAYLMVFDDAFPGLNQVIGFVKRSAQAMALGDADKVRDQFEVLSQQLLQREIESDVDDEVEVDESVFEEEEEDSGQGVAVDELTEEERDALESVEQEDLDRLFASRQGTARPSKPEPDIDSLFSRQGAAAKPPKASRKEIEAFLATEAEGQDESTEVAEEAEEEVSLDELLAAEEEPATEEDEEPAEEDEEEEDELEEEAVEEAEEEELDLAELLGEEEEEEEEEEKLEEADEEEDEVDLASLLAEEEEEASEEEEIEEEEESELTGPEISEDEMAALLADTDEEEEEKPAPPPPKKKAAPPPPPPPPKKVAKRKTRIDEDEQGNGDQTLSNDEIDALLG